MEVHAMDVSSAFLSADEPLEETIYMRQPEGFVVPGKEDWVYLLKKPLCGLKQAPLLWYRTVHNVFASFGFKRVHQDWCVWVWAKDKVKVVIPVHVDNLTSNDPATLKAIKAIADGKVGNARFGSSILFTGY